MEVLKRQREAEPVFKPGVATPTPKLLLWYVVVLTDPAVTFLATSGLSLINAKQSKRRQN